MNIAAWIIAGVLAVVAWKALKGVLKLIIFGVAVFIIAQQIYPYILKLLSNFII